MKPQPQPLIEEDLAKMAELIELPENSMPIDGVVVLQYLDSDGESHISFRTSDSYDSHIVGLLYMAAWKLLEVNNGSS